MIGKWRVLQSICLRPKGWNMLRQELRLEEETPLGLYLGCRISKGEATLHDKTKVQTVTYDMETYLEMTVKKYCCHRI